MDEKKRIVILGAGYAGMEAAKVLNKRLKKTEDVEITLIDKNSFHTLMTELHEIAGHRTPKESVMIDIHEVFKGTKVKFCRDEILDIDFEARQLKSESNVYGYDFLIMAIGAEPNDFGVDGVNEHAFTVWSLEQAVKIREHVEDMFDRARYVKDEGKRRQMLTFVVAGAGFTGIEVIGELMDWKKVLCKKYGIDPSEVSLINIEAMPHILPILGEKLRAKATRYLTKKKVKVMVNSSIVKVEKSAVHLENGDVINTETVIWTGGVQGNSFCKDKGFIECKGQRIAVNEHLEAENLERVYVVGDIAYYETDGKPVPQIVENALQMGACAANNVANILTGKEKESFSLKTHGFMVSIGSRYCVAEVVGMRLTGFFAMALKHMVNLHYLWGVGGLRLIWSYLRHEFFNIENRRSFVGGHLAGNVKAIWTVPLRLFLGVMWLLQGLEKVDKGWLDPENIHILPPEAGTGAISGVEQAAEAVTSATQQAAEAVSAWAQPIFSQPPAFYQWFTDTVVRPNAYLFQASVVIMEILIGLALIGGLFVFLASIGSIGLVTNFALSGMFTWESLWYVFAAIAVMTGSSRVFGLDYYAIPWIKKRWASMKCVQRRHLYFD